MGLIVSRRTATSVAGFYTKIPPRAGAPASAEAASAYAYRHCHCYHISNYYAQEQAQAAYDAELRKENPDLHTAPARVERNGMTGPERQ